MATARELLEQADALMRRNRLRDAAPVDALANPPDLAEGVIAEDRAPATTVPGDGGASIAVASDVVPAAIPTVEPADIPPASALAVDRAPDALDDDIPLLTDAVADFPPAAEISPPGEPPPAAASEPAVVVDANFGGRPTPDVEPRADLEPPVDFEPVADFEPTSILGLPVDGGEPSQWPDFVDDDQNDDVALPVSAMGTPSQQPIPGPDYRVSPPFFPAGPTPATAAALVAGAMAASETIDDARAVDHDAAAPLPHPVPHDSSEHDRDAARWNTLAEEVRMQVLQRIDIFTDTGLQEQLTARLQPIVDRASADLVATINQHVGQLLRTYVAEAIEREIEKWRQDAQ